MNHLQSFALFEIRKERDYRYTEDDYRSIAHKTDKSAEAKIRLQIAPIYDWCHKTVTELVEKWNTEQNARISVRKLEDVDPYNPSLNFNSDQEYEDEGYAFTFQTSYCKFFVRRMDGRLTVERIEPQQVVFAPSGFEQELHHIYYKSIPTFNHLLDNDGNYFSKM